MRKINIRIWNADNYAWIQIDNCSLEAIWDYINKLKINKNRIKDFYLKMREDGFIYNIHYTIKNYKKFVKDLIKRFKKLENCCPILIRDMEEEKNYKFGGGIIKYGSDIWEKRKLKRFPLSKEDMKYIKNMKTKIPKSIINKTQKLYMEYITGKLKWFSFWAEEMEKKYHIGKKRKILKGAQPKTDPRPKPNTIPINSISIKEYLDEAISKWRNELSISKTKEDKLIAKCNIDAFQSVRVSILGEILENQNVKISIFGESLQNEEK